MDKAKAAEKLNAAAEIAAQTATKRLPEFTVVQKWLDNEAEIKLKKALEDTMKAISALRDFGLNFLGNAEVDLVMAYVSGYFLYVIICEVKRADTYPWQTECGLPNKQAVNKAEIQLTKDQCPAGRVFQYRVGLGIGQNTG